MDRIKFHRTRNTHAPAAAQMYLHTSRALTSEWHGSPDATTHGRQSRRSPGPGAPADPQRPPCVSPGAAPPVPGSPQPGERGPRLPAAPRARVRTHAAFRPRAASRPPGAARRGANIAQPSKPSPEKMRSEIPPPALLWERKERGRGERENLCEWKKDRPQTFPRVFLEQRGGVGGVTEKLVLQRRKRLSP